MSQEHKDWADLEKQWEIAEKPFAAAKKTAAMYQTWMGLAGRHDQQSVQFCLDKQAVEEAAAEQALPALVVALIAFREKIEEVGRRLKETKDAKQHEASANELETQQRLFVLRQQVIDTGKSLEDIQRNIREETARALKEEQKRYAAQADARIREAAMKTAQPKQHGPSPDDIIKRLQERGIITPAPFVPERQQLVAPLVETRQPQAVTHEGTLVMDDDRQKIIAEALFSGKTPQHDQAADTLSREIPVQRSVELPLDAYDVQCFPVVDGEQPAALHLTTITLRFIVRQPDIRLAHSCRANLVFRRGGCQITDCTDLTATEIATIEETLGSNALRLRRIAADVVPGPFTLKQVSFPPRE